MALRLILVATVFAMSLPVPSRNQSKDFLTDLNQELAEIITAIKKELPDPAVSPLILAQSQPTSQSPQSDTKQITPAPQIAKQSENKLPMNESGNKPEPVQPTQAVESPLDLAFSVIVEEFVHETELTNLEVARNHVNTIPAQTVTIDLMPAPSAEDILHQQKLLQATPTSPVRSSLSVNGSWDDIDYFRDELDLTYQPVELFEELAAKPVHRLTAELPQAWDAVVANISLPETEVLVIEPVKTVDITKTMSDADWWELTRMEPAATVAQAPEQTPPATEPNKPEIKKALRLTAEALAAWSHVFVRAY